MFMQLYRLLWVYSLLRLPRQRISSYSNQQVCQSKLHVTPVKTTKRQAVVAMATECIESVAVFMNDDNPVDAVDVPPLVWINKNLS